MFAVKNSQNRFPEPGDRKNINGKLPLPAPTAASCRPEIGINLSLGEGMCVISDNVLYHIYFTWPNANVYHPRTMTEVTAQDGMTECCPEILCVVSQGE
jgi:hypothetical protein